MLISFVVSSSGRDKELSRCLQSLSAQAGTEYQIETHVMKGDFPNRIEGYRKSVGQWVFFLDEDVVLPSSDWLKKVSTLLQNHSQISVIGGCYKINGGSYISRAYNFICNNWVKASFDANEKSDLIESQNLLGGILAFNKAVLKSSVESLTSSFWGGEDTWMIRQLQKEGVKTYRCEKMDVLHYPSSSLKVLVRRAFLHGKNRSKYELKTKNPRWSSLISFQGFLYLPVLCFHQLIVETGSLFNLLSRKLSVRQRDVSRS